jgi:hypothetical protein
MEFNGSSCFSQKPHALHSLNYKILPLDSTLIRCMKSILFIRRNSGQAVALSVLHVIPNEWAEVKNVGALDDRYGGTCF